MSSIPHTFPLIDLNLICIENQGGFHTRLYQQITGKCIDE